jgi:hypothetical protein
MDGLLRRMPLFMLAFALLGGMLAPVTAQAADPSRALSRTVQWSPNPISRQVTAGAYHETFIATRFYAPTAIAHAAFSIRFGGGIYARPSVSALGNIKRGYHDLAFVVVIPATVRVGRYVGVGRLLRREAARDYDYDGRPLNVIVRVVRAGHPRPVAPVIRWQPANSLGVITVQRGQTVTETASFTSDVALTNAAVTRALGDVATDRGVAITILTPVSTLPSVAAGAPIPVSFTLTATPGARIAAYAAALYVEGSVSGGPVKGLHYGLHFTIDVDAAPATTVSWTGGNYTTFPSVARGSIVTETAVFTTSADVANAMIRLANVHRSRGVRVTLLPLTSATITANTPVTVNVVIDTTQLAAPGFFTGDIFLIAQPAGVTARRLLHYGLHFTGAVQ